MFYTRLCKSHTITHKWRQLSYNRQFGKNIRIHNYSQIIVDAAKIALELSLNQAVVAKSVKTQDDVQ